MARGQRIVDGSIFAQSMLPVETSCKGTARRFIGGQMPSSEALGTTASQPPNPQVTEDRVVDHDPETRQFIFAEVSVSTPTHKSSWGSVDHVPWEDTSEIG